MGKKYQIIYADPPWKYKVYSQKGEGRTAESHYHTMNIEEIRSLPVADIADTDCILFLWGWVFEHVLIQSSAFWERKEDQSVYQGQCHRYVMQASWNTAKSRRKSESVL